MSHSEDSHPNRTVGRKSWLETVMNEPLDPLSILHPSGATPADAGKTTNAEEDGDNTSRSPRKTRGDRKSYSHDIRYQNDGPKLCQWAKEKMGLSDPPSLAAALSVGLRVLPQIRKVEYRVPRLLVTRPEEENNVQKLYGELSKYYQRPAGYWEPQEVLSNLMRDLEAHPELLLCEDKSTPGASTSTTEAGPGSK